MCADVDMFCEFVIKDAKLVTNSIAFPNRYMCMHIKIYIHTFIYLFMIFFNIEWMNIWLNSTVFGQYFIIKNKKFTNKLSKDIHKV